MNWLPNCVIPKRQWPTVRYKEKRAITAEEHQKIIAAEVNPERKIFYQICWHLGASQGDLAVLKGEDVDWENGTVSFFRKKTGVPVLVHLGPEARHAAGAADAQMNDAARKLRRGDTGGHRRRDVGEGRNLNLLARANFLKTPGNIFAYNTVLSLGFPLPARRGERDARQRIGPNAVSCCECAWWRDETRVSVWRANPAGASTAPRGSCHNPRLHGATPRGCAGCRKCGGSPERSA